MGQHRLAESQPVNSTFNSKKDKQLSNTKKQHYVPQFLLKKFGVGKKNKEKLWVLDKRTEKVYQASVRDVGHENRFYQYVNNGELLDPEELLENVEAFTAPIVSRINKSGKLNRSYADIIPLSHFVATQMLRSPSVRNDMENFRQLVIHKWGPNIKAHPDDPKKISEYGPEDAKFSSLKSMGDIPHFAKLLQAKVWALCEAPLSEPFIISDNPVTKHNLVERKGRGNLGIKNDGIEIYLPISPEFTLLALCPKMSHAATLTPQLSEKYTKTLNEGVPIQQAPENAKFLNSLQVIWAERFVYAKSKKHLEMPRDMLTTNPELKEGPGTRQKKDEI